MSNIMKLAKYFNPTDNIVVVDIGAYTGIAYKKADILTSYPNMVIHAIEPCPKNYGILKDSEVQHTYKFAIGDRNCETKLFITDIKSFGSSEGNSVFENALKKKNVEYYELIVPMYTLDEFVFRAQIEKIDILSINCEGGEYLIFSAPTKKFLDITNTICVDMHSDINGVNSEAVIAEIESHNFVLIKISKKNTYFYVKERLL